MPNKSKLFIRVVTSYRDEFIAVVLATVISVVLAVIYSTYIEFQPARGYTTLGLTLGVASAVFILVACLYSSRKRVAQEFLPGRMQSWLLVHVAISLVLLGGVFFHSGFHLDGHVGTWTLLVLLVALSSGVWGWWSYLRVPNLVALSGGNLASKATDLELRQVTDELSAAKAGRSGTVLGQAIVALESGAPSVSTSELSEADANVLRHLAQLRQRQFALRKYLAQQQRYRKRLRVWLWVHVPAAVLTLPLLLVHFEPPRVLRRLLNLRDRSRDEEEQIFPGSTRAFRSHGV